MHKHNDSVTADKTLVQQTTTLTSKHKYVNMFTMTQNPYTPQQYEPYIPYEGSAEPYPQYQSNEIEPQKTSEGREDDIAKAFVMAEASKESHEKAIIYREAGQMLLKSYKEEIASKVHSETTEVPFKETIKRYEENEVRDDTYEGRRAAKVGKAARQARRHVAMSVQMGGVNYPGMYEPKVTGKLIIDRLQSKQREAEATARQKMNIAAVNYDHQA